MTKKLNLNYPAATRGKVVLWGMVGSQPFGGMIWQVLHYLVVLRRLGFDVWYVEDSEREILDPVTYHWSGNYRVNAQLVGRFLSKIGLGDRWVIRRASGLPDACFGATDSKGLNRLYREAAVAINLCGAQEYRYEFSTINCLVYLETDPVQNQVGVANDVKDYIQTPPLTISCSPARKIWAGTTVSFRLFGLIGTRRVRRLVRTCGKERPLQRLMPL
jgi:hypothetical protein